MKIDVIRIANINRDERPYCIGHLYIDGEYFCDTLEPYDRGLVKTNGATLENKIINRTAIPAGTYEVRTDVRCTKVVGSKFFQLSCGCNVPKITGVPTFEDIYITVGNSSRDTKGSILVGENKRKGEVLGSPFVFERLIETIRDKQYNRITLNVTREYQI